jgi:hypothetical protein
MEPTSELPRARMRSAPRALRRGAEDVAERSARVGRAVLGDGFLLLGHFQRLDRHLDLAGLAVELGDAGVDLLAGGETLRALVGAVAGEFGARMKAVMSVPASARRCRLP